MLNRARIAFAASDLGLKIRIRFCEEKQIMANDAIPMESSAVRALPSVELDMSNDKHSKHDALSDYRLCKPTPAPEELMVAQINCAPVEQPEEGANPVPPADMPGILKVDGEANLLKDVVKDKDGRVTSFKNEMDNTYSLKYDEKGRLKRMTESDSKGELGAVETIHYNDTDGTRITSSVRFNNEFGGIQSTSETEEKFKDGKLTEIRDRNEYSETESIFDDEGREVRFEERDPRNGGNSETIEREFLANGSVSIKSSRFEAYNKVADTYAVFDRYDQHIGPEIGREYDAGGNEKERKETTYAEDGSKSYKFFENGQLTSEVSSVNFRRETDKKGVRSIVETQKGTNGETSQSIEAKFFPNQPYLPTELVVKDADGTPLKTVRIEYATDQRGRLHGPAGVAAIKSLSVSTPEAGTVKTEFENRQKQLGAWRDVFKATEDINSFSIPIGRQPKASSIGPGIEHPVRGQTRDEVTKEVAA
jgi:YD repeat-containing protein